MEAEYAELLDLQEQVQEAVDGAFPAPLWVKAELGSINAKPFGHCYLSFCQSEGGRRVAEVRAVVWSRDWAFVEPMYAQEAGEPLAVGAEVLALVRPVYHPLYGFSLTVSEIKPFAALGENEARRRETIRKLGEEGLMDLQQELALPDLPYALAVISAEDAAGYGDFRKHLLDNPEGYAYRVDLFPAAMQGVHASVSIREALEAAAVSPVRYDAVLILRGGGSALDLACYDDYDLAAAIARCPLPVVTAIGHDRDVHVADLVANRSVKTPTALADLFLDQSAEAEARVEAFAQRITRAFSARLDRADSDLAARAGRLAHLAVLRLDRESAALDLLEMRIRTTDPREVLRRGFALVTGPDGRVLHGAAGAAAGDGLSVLFADGTLHTRVEALSLRPNLPEYEKEND